MSNLKQSTVGSKMGRSNMNKSRAGGSLITKLLVAFCPVNF